MTGKQKLLKCKSAIEDAAAAIKYTMSIDVKFGGRYLTLMHLRFRVSARCSTSAGAFPFSADPGKLSVPVSPDPSSM